MAGHHQADETPQRLSAEPLQQFWQGSQLGQEWRQTRWGRDVGSAVAA